MVIVRFVERGGEGKKVQEKPTLSHSRGSPSSFPHTTHACGVTRSTGCLGIFVNASFGRARNTVVFWPAAMLDEKKKDKGITGHGREKTREKNNHVLEHVDTRERYALCWLRRTFRFVGA